MARPARKQGTLERPSMQTSTLAYSVRAAFVALLTYFLASGRLHVVAANLPAFLITLPLLWAARKDSRYYHLDISIISLFFVNASLFLIDFWNRQDSPFGFDKILHLLAGAWVAALAIIALSRFVKNPYTLAACTLLSVGAMAGWWEVFEWLISILPPPLFMRSTGYTDSMHDIIAVTLGGIITIAGWQWQKRRAWH
ncbi:hypothetical protein HY641_00310 [Candidatus Woesearchaeota archaeon]|nr:hypothetical protein [Candidatus Woesearchaeota archaeon]